MSQTIHRALLLAAGRGKRLGPLTSACPKPMVRVAGRPVLEWVLLGLRRAGIDEAVIVRGYLGDVIEEYFGDGSALGMRLQYRSQHNLTGTAGAMLAAEDLCGDEPFLLHWGDIILDPANYPAVQQLYAQAPDNTGCILGIHQVADPSAGGAVFREHGRVTHLIEKPAPGTVQTNWVVGGLIALTPEIWGHLHQIRPPESGEFFVTEAIDMMINTGRTVLAHEIIGQRVHLTCPDDVAALVDDPRIARWERELTA